MESQPLRGRLQWLGEYPTAHKDRMLCWLAEREQQPWGPLCVDLTRLLGQFLEPNNQPGQIDVVLMAIESLAILLHAMSHEDPSILLDTPEGVLSPASCADDRLRPLIDHPRINPRRRLALQLALATIAQQEECKGYMRRAEMNQGVRPK